MTLEQLSLAVRRNLNDPDGSIFNKEDIDYYINEAIQRFRSIYYFQDEPELLILLQEPIYIPNQYHYLLSVYSSSRCFAQDERHYQATTFMNEFEVKMEEMIEKIESGEIVVTDSEGLAVEADYEEDYVVDVYFAGSTITELPIPE